MNADLLNWIAETWLGNAMRDIFWMWPFMENFHFFGLSLMFGALLAIDLRVIGVANFIPMRPVMWLIPVALLGFAINLITGIAFITGPGYAIVYVCPSVFRRLSRDPGKAEATVIHEVLHTLGAVARSAPHAPR